MCILIRFSLSDIITLIDPNSVNRYTYDNRTEIGEGFFGVIYEGLILPNYFPLHSLHSNHIIWYKYSRNCDHNYFAVGKDQNRRAVAIKIARYAEYSREFKTEVASYRTLNDTGEQIHFYLKVLITKLKNLIGFAPKLYAHFRNSDGLYVLVMELLGMSLANYMTALTDEVDHRMIIRIQVQMVSFK